MNSGILKSSANRSMSAVAIAIFVTKLLGYARDVIVINTNGFSGISDMYVNIIQFIPGMIFTSIGLSLAHVSMPYIIGHQENKIRRNEYFSSLVLKIFIYTLVISGILFLFAPALARMAVPLLPRSLQAESIFLVRIMAFTFFSVCMTFTFKGILQAHGHYTFSILVSIPFNLVVIAVILIWPQNVKVAGIAFFVAWIIQFLVQIPYLKKHEYRFRILPGNKDNEVRESLKSFIPILIGGLFIQLCYASDRYIAAGIGEGIATGIYTGNMLFSTTAGIVISAIGTVIFPKLTRSCIKEDMKNVRSLIKDTFKLLFSFIVPFIIAVICYNKDIVRLFLQFREDKFTEENVVLAATIFLFYSLAVFGFAGQEIFNKIFYARKKYMPPMILSIVFVILNLLLNIITYRSLGYRGIVASTAFTFFIYSITGIIIVQKCIGRFFDRELTLFIVKLCIPAGLMAACLIVFKLFLPEVFFFIPLVIGGISYLASAYLLCYRHSGLSV